jgi:hypothetical protein
VALTATMEDRADQVLVGRQPGPRLGARRRLDVFKLYKRFIRSTQPQRELYRPKTHVEQAISAATR